MSCPAGFAASKRTPFADMTETMVPGDKANWCDVDITWSKNHFRASQLEPLRQMGDDLADSALVALGVKPRQDALVALREYTSRPIEDQLSDAPRQLLEHMSTVPEWVDWDKIQRGQAVFWFVKVLNSTGYVRGSKSNERVFETTQFLLDVFNTPKSLSPGYGNVGWESIVQVRLLHAGVRTRLTKIARAHSKYYNIEEHGVPINQEDLLATQFALSHIMWKIMENRLGVFMTLAERDDFLHVWRYIGYVIGIEDVLDVTSSPERAAACADSIHLHISQADEQSGKMCTSFFQQLVWNSWFRLWCLRWNLPDPYKFHVALSETLLGPTFWHSSQLPSMTGLYRVIVTMYLYYLAADLWIFSKLPKDFWRARRYFFRRVLGQVQERSQFELKAVPQEGAAPVPDIENTMLDGSRGDGDLQRAILMATVVAVGVGLASYLL